MRVHAGPDEGILEIDDVGESGKGGDRMFGKRTQRAKGVFSERSGYMSKEGDHGPCSRGDSETLVTLVEHDVSVTLKESLNN